MHWQLCAPPAYAGGPVLPSPQNPCQSPTALLQFLCAVDLALVAGGPYG
jgi:hypothetical protein